MQNKKVIIKLCFSLVNNRKILTSRLEHVKDIHSNQETDLMSLKRDCLTVERQANNLKSDVLKVGKQMDLMKSSLLSRGLSAEMMDQWLDQSDPSPTPQPVSGYELFSPLVFLRKLWLAERRTYNFTLYFVSTIYQYTYRMGWYWKNRAAMLCK